MEDFPKYLGVNRRLAVICCIICVFLEADGNRIYHTAGTTVTLYCSNNSINYVKQLTWTRNGDNLFSFMAQRTSNSSSVTSNSSCITLNSSQISSNMKCIRYPAAASLNLSLSTLESKLYALIIESAQKTHTGNYTCETTTDSGLFEEKRELIITEPVEETAQGSSHVYAAAVIVPCVCLVIFAITALIILRGICKQRSQNITQPPRRLHQQKEPVYENLEHEGHQRSVKIQIHPYKYRADDVNHT